MNKNKVAPFKGSANKSRDEEADNANNDTREDNSRDDLQEHKLSNMPNRSVTLRSKCTKIRYNRWSLNLGSNTTEAEQPEP